MPEQQIWGQFKTGWAPSDDAISGRKDGLLQMDNLELDKNGSLSLVGGTLVEGAPYANNAHTLGSNVIGATRYDYVADVAGNILRNGTLLGGAGDNTNGAFGSAYNYTLACSGNLRLKDPGSSTPVNLGIATPPTGPTAIVDGYTRSTYSWIADMTAATTILGTWVLTSVDGLAQMAFTTDAATNIAAVQSLTYSGGTPIPYDSTVLQAVNSTNTAIANLGSSPNDEIKFIVAPGLLISGDISPVQSVTIVILVSADGTNYFTYTWVNDGTQGQIAEFTVQRNQFTRVGTGNGGWNSVYGFSYTVICTSSYSGLILTDGFFYGATLFGDYDWVQVHVNSNSSYTGLSEVSPGSSSYIYVPNNSGGFRKPAFTAIAASPYYNTVRIVPYTIGLDPQVNEIWIFRRGGTLQQFYRVLVFTAANWTVPQYDYLSDVGAETIGITANLNLVSIDSAGISAKIYDILGPIEGRWFYFTSQFIYPSDINDPDLVDVSLAVRATGSSGEIYMWARKVGYNQILVGTSRDIYLLTGTFVTLPDGTIDVYYDSIGCKNPPITYDAAYASGQVFYLAADGWRATDQNNNNELLVAPNTDRLYRGITAYGYSVNVQIKPGTVRFPCVFARNKLWCGITGQSRIEVLDSVRVYWRNFSINRGDCTAICSTQDGQILGFFASDKSLRILDQQSTLRIDGINKQTINILSPVFDNATPRQRHELYTIKIRLQTGNTETLSVSIIDDQGTSHFLGTMTSNGSVTEQVLDLSSLDQSLSLLPKTWQYSLTGQFSNFTLEDIELDFDTRPIQLSYLRLLPSNFGSASKKRARVWPHILDTLGNSIRFTPDIDGVPGVPANFLSTFKQTLLYFYNTDVFGIDYGGIFLANTPGQLFEYFGSLALDIVQLLPIARQFDQVGSEELFRYGKIKQIELRVLPFGTNIPYEIFMNDNFVIGGNFNVKNGIEQSYFINVPPGTAGSIARITFGPTAFNFHRFYVRLQVMKSGRDTETEWITLPDPAAGE